MASKRVHIISTIVSPALIALLIISLGTLVYYYFPDTGFLSWSSIAAFLFYPALAILGLSYILVRLVFDNNRDYIWTTELLILFALVACSI